MPWTIGAKTGVTAIHAALVNTAAGAAIVYYGGYFGDAGSELFDCTAFAIASIGVAETPPPHIFCGGHALLADGRWLVAGGQGPEGQHVHEAEHLDHDDGDVHAHIFRPRAVAWQDVSRLSFQPGSQTHGGGRWYPTLIALANGEVLAAQGHPSITDFYPAASPAAPYAERRHCNNTPERYSPALDTWTLLALHRTTDLHDRDEYPRMHVTPSGHVFFATRVWDDAGLAYKNAYLDPYTGAYAGFRELQVDGAYHQGSGETTVLLPLLPNDLANAWVLACNAGAPVRLNVAASTGWQSAGMRQLGGSPVRTHGCAVLLPTGQVFVCGGVRPPPPNSAPSVPYKAVKQHEIYTPPIDWSTQFGKYAANKEGSWSAATAGQGASVARGYHSLALLMPDGRVFTAGSTDRASLESSGVGAMEAGSAVLTLGSGAFKGSDAGLTMLVPGAADDDGVPQDLSTVILNVDSSTQATLSTQATHAVSGTTVWWGPFNERRIEIWSPDWFGNPARPSIDLAKCQPSVGYGEHFDVPLKQNAKIARVALTRCGSVTHSFDSDQRYVALEFTQTGPVLNVVAPDAPGIAPPGNYLLWVVDSADLPAKTATFMRLSYQHCKIVSNHSTFSRLEAEAAQDPQGSGPSVFSDALFVFFEGCMPHELGAVGQAPVLTFRKQSASGAVIGSMHAKLSGTAFESQGLPPDIAQTWIFSYNVVFDDLSAFTFQGTDQVVNVEAVLAHHRCDEHVRLTKTPNPYMSDGKVPWLSRDLRVFTIQPGTTTGDFTYPAGTTPTTFIKNAIAQCNASDPALSNPFDSLPTGQQESALELDAEDENGLAYYSFALARVRYRANVAPAEQVKVFFRLFNTWGPAMEFDESTTYHRTNAGPDLVDSIALLGRVGPELYSIPFFSEPRVTPKAKMETQPDPANRGDIPPAGAKESFRYYGCWLDVNQDEHHLPYDPLTDGPYYEDPLMGGPLQSIADKIRGAHQCLVAEILYEPDLTQPGQSPESSDNLAQRNIAWAPVGNPGDPPTRTALHTFLVKPSLLASDAATGRVAASLSTVLRTAPRRHDTDELVIWWNDLPPDSTVTLYMPRFDADEILAMASRRLGPPVLERVDAQTIACRTGNVSVIPLPGTTDRFIPGLISVELPAGIVHGEDYRVVMRQIEGRSRRVIGTAELAIPVKHAPEILPREIRTLAAMKRIRLSLRSGDPWQPVFERYVQGLADRVRGFGGDPDAVKPSGGHDERPAEPDRAHEGKPCRLEFDCFGEFEGFVLATCHGEVRYECRERAIEEVIRDACAERRTVTVYTGPGQPRRPLRIAVHCPGC